MAFRPVPDSRGTLTIDPEARGKHGGHIVFPWSRDDSGWGSLATPVGIVSAGEGPTVLVVGGNHGDEVEGPLAVRTAFADLDPRNVSGTVVFLPSLNHAAVAAGRRTSPIDGGNMNRSFLGRADGSVTEQIAHFVESCFIERADAVLDLHSGGRSMYFAPFAATHRLPSSEEQRRACAAVESFGAPYGLVLEELDMQGMLDSAVECRGKLFVTTELGGGGSTVPSLLEIARRGVRNFLVHVGVLPETERHAAAPPKMLTNSSEGYISAPGRGLVQYEAELGTRIRAGECLALLYDIEDISAPAREIVAPTDGLFIGRFHGGMTQRGDFLGLIAQDIDLTSL